MSYSSTQQSQINSGTKDTKDSSVLPAKCSENSEWNREERQGLPDTPQSALPTVTTGNREIKHGVLLIERGARYDVTVS